MTAMIMGFLRVVSPIVATWSFGDSRSRRLKYSRIRA